jgi:hypothetical protein
LYSFGDYTLPRGFEGAVFLVPSAFMIFGFVLLLGCVGDDDFAEDWGCSERGPRGGSVVLCRT